MGLHAIGNNAWQHNNTFKSQFGNKIALSNRNKATKQHFKIQMWQQNNTFKSKCGNTITLSNPNVATKQHFQIKMWQQINTFKLKCGNIQKLFQIKMWQHNNTFKSKCCNRRCLVIIIIDLLDWSCAWGNIITISNEPRCV